MLELTTPIILLLLILIAATCTDIQRHCIPNILSLGGIVLGLGFQIWAFGVDGLLIGMGGFGVGLLILLPFYAFGGMGAGDVKLMAAVGTFLGPFNALLAAACTLMAGGVLGLIVLLIRRGGMASLHRYGSTLHCLVVTGQFSYIPPAADEAAATRFPYALAILTGTVIALWIV